MPNRQAHIETEFSEHMRSITAVPLPLSRKRWEHEAPTDPMRLHRPFGWMPPFEQVAGFVVFPFCAELINEQTQDLSDADFATYLTIILFSCDLHVTHRARPVEDREQLIDRTLYDIAPTAMALLSRVQMSALDTEAGL